MSINLTKKEFKRLPTSVIPVNYKLKIATDFSTFLFIGEERIEIDVKEVTDTITLNCLNLKVTDVFFHQGKTCFPASEVNAVKDEELIVFKFPNTLPTGRSELALKFEGKLADNMRGFYLSKYTEANGKEHFIASTQFEATDARKAFPCWDEPSIKATFEVTLVAPKDKVILSNTNVIEKHEDLSTVTYCFSKTPIMSTYLVAYIVGDLDFITKVLDNGLKISIYTPVGKSHMGQFALEVACKTVPFYTEYFDVSYPLPKLDLVAIPDFAMGAMENWGLVTYREMALLIDEKSSASAKQYVALVVGHEIAHQWFGNLVTMEWWTDLWLNEGFATWIEYLSVDHCFPSYHVWKSFATVDYSCALELDGLRNSHPIEVKVGNPSEIDEIFDAISYSKGACVIRMLYDFIGQEAFTKGLGNYLKHFSYKNAKTADLWNFLGEASKKPIGMIMTSWTSQMGYPLITVTQKAVSDGVDLSLSQERFISDGSKSDVKMKWIIPVSVVSSENPDKPIRVIFENETETVHVPLSKSPSWIKLNYHQIGFYRVKYPSDMFSSLVSNLQCFIPEERLGFLNDAFSLARCGKLETTQFLDLMAAFTEEKDNVVWEEISSSVLSILNLMYYSKESKKNTESFKKVMQAMLKPVYTYVGVDKSSCMAKEETHHILLLRATVLNLLAKSGCSEILTKLKALCELHITGKQSASPDIRSALFYSKLSSNEESDYNKLIEYYKGSHETEEKVRILRSFSALSKPELVHKALEFSISNDVRPQDTPSVFISVASNSMARDLAWDFLKTKWSFLLSRYDGGPMMYRFIKGVISGFAKPDIQKDIKTFFEHNPAFDGGRSLQQGLESIDNKQRWLQRDEASITAWLAKH